MGALHFSGTCNEVYPALARTILNSGAEIEVRGTKTREWTPVVLELERTEERLVTSYGRPVNVAFALAEVLWILQGDRRVEPLEFYNSKIRDWSDDGVFFNAAYGHRLVWAHGYNQLEDVILTLQDDPGSRQATLVMWHPNDRGWYRDPELPTVVERRLTKDRACNLMAHLMIRDEQLRWLQVVRSNDVILGVPYNFMQFTHLQEYIARRLDVEMGPFTYVADSMHAYVDDGYYKQVNDYDIKMFDLYRHLAPPPPMTDTPGWLEEVAVREKLIRVRAWEEAVENVNPEGGLWHTALWLWSAHFLYKIKHDLQCWDILRTLGFYGAAQARFYFANRWGSIPNTPGYDEFRYKFGDEVAKWIIGEPQ